MIEIDLFKKFAKRSIMYLPHYFKEVSTVKELYCRATIEE